MFKMFPIIIIIFNIKCIFLCQDEDEFPDLTNERGVQRSTRPESNSMQTHIQPKLPKNLVGKGSLRRHLPQHNTVY